MSHAGWIDVIHTYINSLSLSLSLTLACSLSAQPHTPRKVGDVDELLEQWAGQEDVLHAKVVAKYLGTSQLGLRAQIEALYANHDPHPHEK